MVTFDDEVRHIQQMIDAKAQGMPLPARFHTNRNGSQVTITDIETSRQVTIALCNYGGVRKVLDALFEETCD